MLSYVLWKRDGGEDSITGTGGGFVNQSFVNQS